MPQSKEMRERELGSAPARMAGQAGRRLLQVALCAALVWACSSTPHYVWASSLPQEPAASLDTAPVAAGDTIAIAVWAHDSLGGSHVVGLEGYIVVPLVGAVHVAGRTPDEIVKRLEALLQVSIESPKVSVVVMEKRLEVSVLGEVTRPGKYAVSNRDGVASTLALAGGLTEFADTDSIYLIRQGSPRIRFRMRDLLAGGNGARPVALRDGDLVVIE